MVGNLRCEDLKLQSVEASKCVDHIVMMMKQVYRHSSEHLLLVCKKAGVKNQEMPRGLKYFSSASTRECGDIKRSVGGTAADDGRILTPVSQKEVISTT